MRIRLAIALPGLILGVLPAPASAQGLGASVHVGTLGIGGRVAVPLGERVNLRAGADLQPVAIEVDISDVMYDLKLPSPSLTVLLDVHLGGSSFRVSGGGVYFARGLELEGTPATSLDIGGREYDPSEVGALVGSLGTARFAPYFGIGWGNSPSSGLSFSADLGVGFHGTPDVRLGATGPIGQDPQFLADLEAGVQEANKDIESVRIYPSLNLGLSFGL